NLAVKLAKENQKIDVGGIAKGYIADKLIEFYKLNNVSSAIINLGGNIKILGKKSETDLWNVGIYCPKKHSNTTICSIELEDKSIVTSGGYERAFMNNGEVYHHILNPVTGYPAKTDLKSITIISDSSLEGDALSTPLFIMGKYQASSFMKKNKLSGVMVTEEDEIIMSKDLISKFKLIDNYKVLAF
ncbi:MAG: FAD:protein FMN transferase, partial [Peptostreptococcaceae bacterium]